MAIIPENKAKIKPGDSFGALTVLGRPFRLKITGRRDTYAVCECECGKVIVAFQQNLLRGNTSSCGCVPLAAKTKHGHSRKSHGRSQKSRLYTCWSNMKRRCMVPSHPDYDNYGGRGITVSEEWHEFEPFRDWALANGYEEHLTLDRRRNWLGYSRDNCRWATYVEQAQNTRSNVSCTAFGETKTVADWGRDERCLVTTEALRVRLWSGWDAEQALSTPKLKKGAKPRAKRYTAFGESKTIKEWSLDERFNQNHKRISDRLKRGWSVEDALTVEKIVGWECRNQEARKQTHGNPGHTSASPPSHVPVI